MKRYIYSLITAFFGFVFFTFNISAQTYNGSLTLTTQAQVDAFNYTTVKGSLEISGPDIKNINALSKLKTIGSILNIHDTDSLKNIDSLSNLTSAKRIKLSNNKSLLNLDGLSGIGSLESIQISGNESLVNTDGLLNLKWLGRFDTSGSFNTSLEIQNNANLRDLNGFKNTKTLYANIAYISNNPLLTEYCGIYNLIQTGTQIGISGNGANPTDSEIVANGPCSLTRLTFIADINGRNETPPVITPGSGGGMFVLNQAQDTLEFWIRLCQLQCPFKEAHFHLGAPGVPGPVVKTITTFFKQDTMGYVAHGFWTSSDPEALTPALVSDLISGNIYVNIHSESHPGGEERGQITSNKPITLYANLDGLQEVPPNMVTASGTGLFTLRGDGELLDYSVQEHGVSMSFPVVNFQKGAFGHSGPVVGHIVWFYLHGFGKWVSGSDMPLTPELAADLLGCNLFVNIHTERYPEGEIRGQIYKRVDMTSSYMTIWGTKNDDDKSKNSKLVYYSLKEGSNFENNEGEITGYTGDKNIVSFTTDIGGNFYFLNNTWASMLYLITPDQVDHDPATPLKAIQIGRTHFSDGSLVNVSNIKFINGKLYGINNKTNALYDISPFDASVRQIAVINILNNKSAGLSAGSDGNVYVLKNVDDNSSELWKFNNFPGSELTLAAFLPAGLESITSHPNGNLYAADKQNLYEINLKNKMTGVLANHEVSVSGMDFDYEAERNETAGSTLKFETISGLTGVDQYAGIPTEYKLEQNYPNPFNPSTVIRYSLPEAGFVKLNVYNVLGQKVRTLINENKEAGIYEAEFQTNGLASGLYIYKIEAGKYLSTRKMILLK